MILSVASFQWRNLEDAHLELDQGVNLVVGRNAQGKTNLLEAVHLLSTGKPLRGVRDSETIRRGCDRTKVLGVLALAETEIAVEIGLGTRKKVTCNGLALPRASDLMGRAPTVTFCSADLGLIREDPAFRRNFLDTTLAQLRPGYLQAFSHYRRALEQRNSLLKVAQEQPVEAAHFEVWEADLAHYGSQVRRYRVDFVEKLAELSAEFHRDLAGPESLSISYPVTDEDLDEKALVGSYGGGRVQEIRRGSTLFGPHRDDLKIDINGSEAKLFGSQGQQRSATLAVKMAVLRWAHEHQGIAPILLLDDVFAELDRYRQSHLVDLAFRTQGQVLLTCTEIEQVSDDLVSKSSVWMVEAGQVRRV